MTDQHGWQPIETAPRDETLFWGWDVTNGFYAASFNYENDDGSTAWATSFWEPCRPTHWQPLPPPPGDAP